jgi:CBS domain containing-hemolysin-like protein
MSSLGRVPKVGDEVDINSGRLLVSSVDGFRVDRIQFIATAVPAAQDGDEA